MYSWRHCSVRTCTSQMVSKISRSKSSSLSLPLKLSTYPFSQGLPGVMKRVVAPTPWSHNRTALAVNSGPLSERRCSGTPRWTMRSPRHSMTWGERNERPTWMARHSLVYSSTTVRRRTGLPSLVRGATKSYAQTWFRRCGLSLTQEPSVSQSRPRLGCLAGTLSPPRRQIRSTRLWFHSPSLPLQHGSHPPVPIPSIPTGQPNHRHRQGLLVVSHCCSVPLC